MAIANVGEMLETNSKRFGPSFPAVAFMSCVANESTHSKFGFLCSVFTLREICRRYS